MESLIYISGETVSVDLDQQLLKRDIILKGLLIIVPIITKTLMMSFVNELNDLKCPIWFTFTLKIAL